MPPSYWKEVHQSFCLILINIFFQDSCCLSDPIKRTPSFIQITGVGSIQNIWDDGGVDEW